MAFSLPAERRPPQPFRSGRGLRSHRALGSHPRFQRAAELGPVSGWPLRAATPPPPLFFERPPSQKYQKDQKYLYFLAAPFA
jgi:hypothetical protein